MAYTDQVAILSDRPLRRSRRARRVFALFMVGWLNLMLEPCFASMDSAMPVGMEQCDHGGDAGYHHGNHAGDSCASMQADDCTVSDYVSADAGRGESPRIGALLLTLPPGADLVSVEPATGPPPLGGEPSLHIRYCNLRN